MHKNFQLILNEYFSKNEDPLRTDYNFPAHSITVGIKWEKDDGKKERGHIQVQGMFIIIPKEKIAELIEKLKAFL